MLPGHVPPGPRDPRVLTHTPKSPAPPALRGRWTQHLHDHICWDFSFNPPKHVDVEAGPAPPSSLPCTGLRAGHPRTPLASLRYSVWCLVATKTTVWSWGFTTLRSRWSSTAGLSSPRTWKNASCTGRAELSPAVAPRRTLPPLVPSSHARSHCRVACRRWGHQAPHRLELTLSCSLSLVSTSRRISIGSVRPVGRGDTWDVVTRGTWASRGMCHWDQPHPLTWGPA